MLPNDTDIDRHGQNGTKNGKRQQKMAKGDKLAQTWKMTD